MTIETIHREREILFKLLRLRTDLRNDKEIREIIGNLIATMEPEDVELVKKQVMELEKGDSI